MNAAAATFDPAWETSSVHPDGVVNPAPEPSDPAKAMSRFPAVGVAGSGPATTDALAPVRRAAACCPMTRAIATQATATHRSRKIAPLPNVPVERWQGTQRVRPLLTS